MNAVCVNRVGQVACWVAKIGPLYTLDCGSAVGSLELMDETFDELERRMEDASQLRAKAVQYVSSIMTSSAGEGK